MEEEDGKIIYECAQCGACCRWPGDVCVEEEEIAAMAACLKMSEEEFVRDFCGLRKNRQGLTILENEDGSCMMLSGNLCRINEAKPAQCRDFPHQWNFPGWRELCQCREVRVRD